MNTLLVETRVKSTLYTQYFIGPERAIGQKPYLGVTQVT